MAKKNAYVPYESSSAPVAFDNVGNGTVQNRLLGSASTAENIAVTSSSNAVRMRSNADFWCEFDATAAVPTGDETTGGSIFVPAGVSEYVQCSSVTNISVVSATANAIVNAIFWD